MTPRPRVAAGVMRVLTPIIAVLGALQYASPSHAWPVSLSSVTICNSSWSPLPVAEVLRIENYGNRIYVKAEGAGGNPNEWDSVGVRIATSITDPTGVVLVLDEYESVDSGKFRGYMAITASSTGLTPPLGGEGIGEYASADYSDTDADADAFDAHCAGDGLEARGAARNSGGALSYPAVNVAFMKAAGVEKIFVQWPASGTPSVMDAAWVKNQADWLYFSGHGVHASGKLRMCDGAYSFGYSEAAANWQGGDIDRAIFAACSVLDINDWNNEANDGNSPGEQWETLGLSCMFGYNWVAPDAPEDVTIVDQWLDNGGTISGWLDENVEHGGDAGYRACVIYQSGGSGVYKFWKYDKDMWGNPKPNTAVKRTCYESEGWDILH